MYEPPLHRKASLQAQQALIRRQPLGLLISYGPAGLEANSIPFLIDARASKLGTLRAHMARANGQWRSLSEASEALVIFQGPDRYISPSWYANAPAVPTWNYAAVHVYGIPRAIHDAEQLARLVDRMVAAYEAGMTEPWPGILPAEFKASMLKAIVGFSIEIDRIEGKFKLGQNRPLEDRLATVAQLEASSDPAARELAALTRRHLAGAARG